jgi:hypothetical protein
LKIFLKKIVSIAFALVLFLTGGVFFVQADESAEKVSLELSLRRRLRQRIRTARPRARHQRKN